LDFFAFDVNPQYIQSFTSVSCPEFPPHSPSDTRTTPAGSLRFLRLPFSGSGMIGLGAKSSWKSQSAQAAPINKWKNSGTGLLHLLIPVIIPNPVEISPGMVMTVDKGSNRGRPYRMELD